MIKIRVFIIVILIIYLGIGTAYSRKANYCEEQKLRANPELNSNGKENEGSNLIGRTISTLFWPLFIASDKINHGEIFDCAK